jgi:hypothetical protein
MASTGDDKLIRKALIFLTKVDKAVIKSADILEKLEGNPPSNLLGNHSFTIEGFVFKGTMTLDQYNYLNEFADTLEDFFTKLSLLLLGYEANIVNILASLNVALDVPNSASMKKSAHKGKVKHVSVGNGGGVAPPPVLGSCNYDTAPCVDGVSQSFCVGGLGGEWSTEACNKIRPTKAKR